MATREFNATEFWSGQDFQTSARLHLQHWIWNYQFGHLLHPKINTDRLEPLRIADIAAGNGVWILELARSLPLETTQFDAFDVTSSNFPSQAWLAPKLKFHTWDAFSEVPSEYIGVFDIVHIRAFYSCIKSNNVQPVLDNLLKLLKPGGYLQWDEGDASTLSCEVPLPEVKAPATETIVKIQSMFSRNQGQLHPDWLYDLPKTLEQSGYEMVAHDVYKPPNELIRAWNDNMLLVWREMIPMMPEAPVPLPPGMGLPESLNRDSFAELFKRSADECSKGTKVGMVFHVFVAKKPN